MKKYICCVLYFVFCNLAFCEVVKDIVIDGEDRINHGAIKDVIGISVGDDIDQEMLNLLFKRLNAHSAFQDVDLSLNEGILKIVIKENPMLNTLTIKGNNLLSRSQISKLLNVTEKTVLDMKEFQNNLFALKSYYRDSIKDKTKIESNVIPIGDGKVDIELVIKEAKPVPVHYIKIEGNLVYSDAILKKIISTKEQSILRLFSSAVYYSKSKSRMDEQYIASFYQSKGYLDCKIIKVDPQKNDDGSINLIFHIHEGMKYKFGAVDLDLGVWSDVDKEEILRQIKIKKGSVFNSDGVREGMKKIVNALGEKGHYMMDVFPEYNRSIDGFVDVLYKVKEAKKQILRKITILGNSRTLDSVIRKNIISSENDIFNRDILQQSRKKIFASGFFEDVTLVEKKVDANNIDVDFIVKERSTGTINLSGGYSSDIGFFGNFSFTENNFRGTGEAIGFSLRKSSGVLEISADLQRRDLFDTKLAGTLSVFYRKSGDVLYKNYKNSDAGLSSYGKSSKGFSIGVGYDITDSWSSRFVYSMSQKSLYEKQSAKAGKLPQEIKDDLGNRVVSSVSEHLFYNELDNYYFPRNGNAIRLNTTVAGIGGETRFVSGGVKVGGFTQIFGGTTVMSLIAQVDGIRAYGGYDLTVDDRFMLKDFRGFESDGIGPRDRNGTALGGQFLYRSTVELQRQINLPVELDIRAALFYQTALLTGLSEDYPGIQDSGALRASMGVGLLWNSPFGLLRVDAAYPVVRDDVDKISYITFGVVSPF